ncbi:cytochrome P450 [Frankia sp. AgB1.9]|uniref:cytochrome P450 n=1 Tax=unclassified Frankia TaxID=2632575 RepID=UPI0019346859|nr:MULTISPECIES: cytochrome P450 [unclassified Frankia]MBL7493352.1 cytochrome P450 [Frankia sp. AgW1.1]MBL7552897.1 cytochrome P450 [Frankia sp. AgB1.9]MBL7621076.1 cytochrome P450 [Frankia sp. AgB1.8]
MTTDTAIAWDPYTKAYAADPYPIYQRLREEVPLYYNEQYDFFAVSRFSDIERGLPDWRTFSSAKGGILEIIKSGMELPPGTLIFEDPPAHDIHRKLLSRVFTPKRVLGLETQIRDFCVRTLDPLIGEKQFDMCAAFTTEFPMRVIGMLLGIPEADQASIRDAGNDALRTEDGGQMDLSEGALLSGEYFGDYIDWRRDHPSDDLMTELIRAEFTDENGVTRTLTREEILTYVTVVAGAGNETTGRLIGWATSTLAKFPEARAELVADPSLIPNAIEELLRMEPPGHAIGRYVTTDVEFHGQSVPAGSAMMFIVAAANRDPARYPDPNTFNIRRQIGQQLTFGLGGHYCLGAALARLEGRVALEEILKHFPTWDVDWDNANLASTSTVRGWESLPITIG